MKQFSLFFLSVSMFLPLPGQEKSLAVYDTLKLIRGTRVIMSGGYRVRINRDTTLIINGGLDYRIKIPRGEAGEIFYDSLALKADRWKWTRELHHIVITSPREPDYSDTMKTQVSSHPFMEYGGKYIRSIRFVKLEPFGPTVHDPSRTAVTDMEEFGNKLHRMTRDQVIHNHLLFSEGELLAPNKLADNERILRNLPFILDARIQVSESRPGSDTVDVRIVCKDNFSIGLGGALNDFNAGRINAFEKNLFGMGHELRLGFHWDGDRAPWSGNEALYLIHNLGGSFINARFGYTRLFDSESFHIRLERKFFTPDTKWAGAFHLERTTKPEIISYADTMTKILPLKYNLFDGWAGRSFYLSSKQKITGSRVNLVTATRLYRHHYIDRPELSENSFYEYQNKYVWLSSLSLSAQSFFKSNLILDFGRTEDIPQGMLFSLTVGPEINEFNTRFYSGASFTQGRFLGNLGYLFTRFEWGGFLSGGRTLEQGVFNAKADYFTPLFIVNRFKLRHFVTGSYVRGIQRNVDELIYLSLYDGIRGFRTREASGHQKVALNYEVNAFTPYYLYGFRFIWFGFVDCAMIGPESKKWHDGDFYSGLGIGIRIRNERLVFETITLRLGYYPNHPEKSFPLFLDLYGEERLRPENFFVTKPKLVDYR